MKKFYNPFTGFVTSMQKVILVLGLLALGLQASLAQNNYTGASGGAWHLAGNWSGGIPLTTDNVVIPASTNVVVGAGNPAIQITNITIGAGSDLALSDANFTATGTSTLAGSITDNTAGGNNQFNGAATTTANFSINGNQAFRFCNSFTIGAGFTFTNNCTNAYPAAIIGPNYGSGPGSGVTAATPIPGSGFGGLLIQGAFNGSNASSQFTNGANAYVTVNGFVTVLTTGILDVSATGNTVRWYTSNQPINLKSADYFNVDYQIQGNTPNFNVDANRVISGTMRVQGGRFLMTAASARTLTINGELICNNTNGSNTCGFGNNISCTINGSFRKWANGGGTFGATGTGTLTFASGSFYYHEMNGTNIPTGTVTWQSGSSCQINENLAAATTTTAPGSLGQNFSNFVWNVTDQAAALTPFLRGGTAPTLGLANIAGKFTINSTGAGVLNFNDDGTAVTQNIGSFEQNGGTFFLRGGGNNNNIINTLNVLGNFNQTAGTITATTTGTGVGRISLGGTAAAQSFVANGTISELDRLEINNTSGTPNINLGSNFTTSGVKLTNLVLTAGNLVFGGTARTFTVKGNISGTGGINMSGAAHTLNAEGTVTMGTFTPGTSSTFVYNQGIAGQAVFTTNYANLSFSNFNKTLPAATIGVAGLLSPGSATGHTVTGNTINFNGALAQNIPAFPNATGYNNIQTNGGGTKTLTANALVAGTLIMTSGVFDLAGFNLTVAGAVSPGAAYSSTNMIRTSSTGSFRKTSAALASNFVMVYPVGSGSLYTPYEITSLTGTVASGQVSVRAVGSQNGNVTGSNALDKWWDVSTSGITGISANAQFTYVDPTEVNGTQANYVGRYWDGLTWATPAGISAAGVNPFSTTGTTNLTGEWTAGEPSAFLLVITYTSTGGGGNWTTPGTWTPAGPPTSADNVVIATGSPVTVTTNNQDCANMTIQAGGILTLGTTSGHTYTSISGTGTLRLSSGNLPTATLTNFVSILGGTIEYQGASYALPSQSTYRNLIISGSGTKTSGANMTISGDLTVSSGTGFDLSASNHTLNLAGNFDAQGSYASGTGLHTFTGTAKTIGATGSLSIDNLSISGSYSQTASSFTISSSLAGAGSFTLNASNTLTFGGSASIGSFTASAVGTTVNYNQTSNGQPVLAGTYQTLNFSNFSKILPAGTITVNTSYSPGTSVAHTVTGNTIVFNGANGQTIPGSQYNNISNGNANSRIFDAVNTIYIAGLFTPGSNVYTITGSTIDYNSNGVSQTVADLDFYNNLTFSGTAGVRQWSIGGGIPRTVTISGKLIIGGNANFTIAGNNNPADKNLTVTSTASDAITFNTGTITLTGNVPFNIHGTLINNGGSFSVGLGSSFNFNQSTSVYNHAYNGGSVPGSGFNFVSTALFKVSGVTNTMPTSNASQAFANFEWDCPGQIAPAGFVSGSLGTRTYNNVTIKNTGTSHFLWAASNTYSHAISGNLTIDAGAKSYGYSGAASGNATQTIAGNLVVNGTMELHNDNLGGAAFHSWIVSGNVTIGATGIIQRTSNNFAKIQMAGTVDRVLTITAGGSFTSGLLEINKTAGAKITPASSLSIPGLALTAGTFEVTGGKTLTYTGTASPTRTTGYVALGVGATNIFKWNAPASTAVASFNLPVGPIGVVTGYRPVLLGAFTTPAGSPSISVAYVNNPGTSPTNATSIRSTPSTVISSKLFPEITFTGGTFGTGDITLQADITNDFYNGPISSADMDIFKAPPGAQAWQFIGAGPIPTLVSGSTYSINQAGVIYASGLNRLAIGKSNLVDLGTPQVLTWTGLVSNDWNNGANWSPSQVPSAFNQKVTIPNTILKPVYTGGAPLNIRGLFITLGASVTYTGDLGLDSAFTNSGSFTCTGLFTNSGANYVGPPASSVFNIGGSNGVNNIGGWLITNTSTSGVVVGSSTQKFTLNDSLKLNGTGKLNLNGASLTLLSTAAKTAKIGTIPSTGTLSGATNVTWQRYNPSNTAGWYFQGTPIQGQTVTNWADNFYVNLPFAIPSGFQGTEDRASIFTFDGVINPIDGTFPNEKFGWRILTSPGSLTVGKGFRVWQKGYGPTLASKMYDNTGTITQGDFTFSTPFNASGYDGGGWNLLANPYPAAINWSAPTNGTNWTKTNVNDAIYIWNGANSQYMTFVAGVGTNGGSNIIPAGQAFIVRAAAGATLTARENVKFSGSGTFARVAIASNFLRIKLKDVSGHSDESVLRVQDGTSSGFDANDDALKLDGTLMNLAILSDQGKFSIQSLGGLEDQTIIPLSVKATQAGNFKLEFENQMEFLGDKLMYIRDNFLGTVTLVEENSIVDIQLSEDAGSQADGRFELIFTTDAVTSIYQKTKAIGFHLFPNPSSNGSIEVSSDKLVEGAEIKIVNMKGQVVFTSKLASEQKLWKIETNLAAGIYNVQVKGNQVHWNQKLTIQ